MMPREKHKHSGRAPTLFVCDLWLRTRYRCYLEERVSKLEEPARNGVTSLVDGDPPPLLGLEDPAPSLQARHHTLHGRLKRGVLTDITIFHLKMLNFDTVGPFPGRYEGSFVTHVGNLSS